MDIKLTISILKSLDFTILRNELLKLYDGTQNNNEGVEQKEILLALLKNESVKVKQTYGQIKKNLYETFRESIINQQYQKFDSQFCSQRQAFVRNTCTILSGATERYIFEYLIVLINSLKKAELKIECRNCNKRICSMCRNTEQISKQYSEHISYQLPQG